MAPTFNAKTTAEEVATAFASEIKGKNVLITGTSQNGIGFESARVIAKHANLVIITGYNAERLQKSEDAIKKETPHANVRKLQVDLSSLASVRKAAAEVNSWPEPLHVVIHNAAAGIFGFKPTVDGLEAQIATAYVGPFLFTKLVAPKILAAGSSSYTPRVVFLSSSVHAMGPGVDFEQLEKPTAEKHSAFPAYFASKSATVLGKINSYSVSPGAIFTNINQKEESLADFKGAGMLKEDGTPNEAAFTWKTIPEGAATTTIAAFDPALDSVPGAYLDDSVVANEKVAPHSSDPATAAKLWTVTEKIVGETFTF
ncbi:hypothetical protein B0H16DRAFT_1537292 [Mycena metata]|uniref:NAD(P)-binding protein n=1 Tax=Mycena metata TaxID=1033252 RepID=A0AAD7J853_9AGAR|nr:hypothetical protein B0H16DRAFT_1537292 [Mycena metata]